ncbi:MAG: AmmeMemoRadiSam system protein B [Phycisphaerae bacterium]|jgi:hypothetical protein
MNLRSPVRAGSFYDASPEQCRAHADKLLGQADLPDDLPATIYGGIVPHAGWVYSGKLAAQTLQALARCGGAQTFILFGAMHFDVPTRRGVLYDRGVWRTPVGDLYVDEQLAAAILAGEAMVESNPRAHAYEHSLEVQLPLLKALYPAAMIVPIGVPPVAEAVQIGQAVGRLMADRFPAVRIIGSTDLTHHGGHFPSPGGHGEEGVRWTARNDRRMIDLIEAMEADKIVPEAEAHQNACGAGAIAATIAACRAMGASQGRCLAYTNSYDVIHALVPHDPDDTTVGYASIVFV